MSDWQVGDLAVCVNGDPNPLAPERPRPKQGATYRVRAITSTGYDPFAQTWTHGLALDGLGSDYAPSRFRKIRPDERKACEPEFVTLLKRSRKTVPA